MEWQIFTGYYAYSLRSRIIGVMDISFGFEVPNRIYSHEQLVDNFARTAASGQ